MMRKQLLVALILAMVLSAQFVLAGDRKVLVIHSYDEGLAWTRQCNDGIRSALPDTVLLKTFYLDTKRIPQSEYGRRAEEAFGVFRDFVPDVVMLGDDNALRLLGPRIAETGVPVVYFGINNNPRDYFETLPPNVFGVIERIPLFHLIRWLIQILPETESVLVLLDGSPTGDSLFRFSFKGRESMTIDGKAIRCENISNWSEWRERFLTLEYDFILMPVYHALRDDVGEHISYDQVVAWVSRHSRVPVFAAQDYAVGDNGVVGALVIVGEEHGHHAGRIAKGVLDGEGFPAMATADDQEGRLFFNRKQLARFGIVLPKWAEKRAVFK